MRKRSGVGAAAALAALCCPVPGAADVVWDGGGGDHLWSNPLNWSTNKLPTNGSVVTFDATDSPGTNIVNQMFKIAGLRYLGGGVHVTDLDAINQLLINGPVDIGVGSSTQAGTATWTSGGIVVIGDATTGRLVRIGDNTGFSGTTSGSLTIGGADVEAFLTALYVGSANGGGGTADGTLTVLRDPMINLHGTAAQGADLNIGRNDASNGQAFGLLDATQGTVSLDVDNLVVGSGNGGGTAVGTLRWDHPGSPILADFVYLSLRSGGTGILDVPPGGTIQFGTPADPVAQFRLAYNDTSVNSGNPCQADLDLTVNNPFFEAYIDDFLAIGWRNTNTGTAVSDASLVLGSNSILQVAGPIADLNIGRNDASNGQAFGLLDASIGTAVIDVNTLDVGRSAASGLASGTMIQGPGCTVDATTVRVGFGSAASGTYDLLGGSLTATTITVGAGDAFNFSGGTLSVGTFNGDLDQLGGTLAPGTSPGTTTINGDYSVVAPGVVTVEIAGPTPGSEFDTITVNSTATLGGTLVIRLLPGFDTDDITEPLTILSASNIVGQFDAVELPVLGGLEISTMIYGPGVVQVSFAGFDGRIDFEPEEFQAAGAANREAPGDFDGDGFPDLVIALPDEDPGLNGTVQVFLNQGTNPDGSWNGLLEHVIIPVGRNPSAVTAGDFNGDTFDDIAVANAGDNDVLILLNDRMANFTPLAPTIMVGTDPRAIAAADFQEDANGDIDLVVANTGDDTVQILFNDGAGGFTAGAPILVGANPLAVDPSDLDNDKDRDTVSANSGSNDVSVILNQGGGKFARALAYPAGSTPVAVSVGDLDRDVAGLDDIAVTNFDAAALSVLRNLGGGVFDAPAALPVGGLPRSVEIVELDLFGGPDLALVADDEQIGPAVQVLRNVGTNPGDLHFEAPLAFSVGATAQPNFLVAADFNGDGAADLATVNQDPQAKSGGSVTVLLNNVPCPSDVDLDEVTTVLDFLILLQHWGACDDCTLCPWDLNEDCDVDIQDFLQLLATWGPCLLPP